MYFGKNTALRQRLEMPFVSEKALAGAVEQ